MKVNKAHKNDNAYLDMHRLVVRKSGTNFGQSLDTPFKVIDFGTNRKRVYDFLLVSNSNLSPILHRFGDIAGFLRSRVTPPLFHRNFGCVPVAPDRQCWGQPEQRP